MENQETNTGKFGELGLDAEINLLEEELKVLKKELAICQSIVDKRDSRAKDYLIEMVAIKKDIDVVNQEIALLLDAKEEEELWLQEVDEELYLEEDIDNELETGGIDNEPDLKVEENKPEENATPEKVEENTAPAPKKEKKKKITKS